MQPERPGKSALCWGLLALALLGSGCETMNRQFDHWALSYKAHLVFQWGKPRAAATPLPFTTSEELEKLTRPGDLPEISVAPLAHHRLADGLAIQEELTFASAIQMRHPESNRARAYVYRLGRLGERPVVLWAPGQSTNDADLVAMAPLFEQILERQVDVVFFVPPYHLERTPRGFGSGDAFLATDFPDHLQVFAQGLSDLRTLTGWLRQQGVAVLGAIGSSMGSSLLLRMSSWSPCFDFLTLMIPVMRWDQLLETPEMAPVRARLSPQGLSTEQVAQMYQALDATRDQPRIDPERISVLYGRFDLIAPQDPIVEWTERWGVRRVRAFARGHSLFALGGNNLGRELSNALDDDLVVLLHLRPARPLTRGDHHARVPPGFPMAN